VVVEVEELSSACRGRYILTQVLFDWFRGMSLERTGVGWLGSGVAGVFGNFPRRVIVPSELRTI
jgi:hypothetical protein